MDETCTISLRIRFQLGIIMIKMKSKLVFGSSVLEEIIAWVQEVWTVWDEIKLSGSKMNHVWSLMMINQSQMVLRSCTMLCKNIWLLWTTIMCMVRNETIAIARLWIQDYSLSLNRWAQWHGHLLVEIIAQTFGARTMESIFHTVANLASAPTDLNSWNEEQEYLISQSTDTMVRWILIHG